MKLISLFESSDYQRWLFKKYRELLKHSCADLFLIVMDVDEIGMHIMIQEREDVQQLKLKNLNELNLKQVFIYEKPQYDTDHSMTKVYMSYEAESIIITPDECFAFFMTDRVSNAISMDYDTLRLGNKFFVCVDHREFCDVATDEWFTTDSKSTVRVMSPILKSKIQSPELIPGDTNCQVFVKVEP